MSESNKLRTAGLVTLVAIGLGVLLIIAEFLNGPRTPDATVTGLFGTKSPFVPWAQRAFIVLFGLIHLAVAGIITVFRRTAV